MGSCRRHHLIARRNPADSQGGFQIPSAASLIRIQLCLPTRVSKMHTEIQKGILFPANNYPVSSQPSLSTLKITNITNAGKSSGFAARRLKRVRPRVTDLHPESSSSSWVSSHEPTGAVCTLLPGVLSFSFQSTPNGLQTSSKIPYRSAEKGFRSFSPCVAKELK